MLRFKYNAIKNLVNIVGWRTNKKIIVFESDDWGSIRMPSLKAFKKLKFAGLDLKGTDAERYNKNDNLATKTDLENLFEILLKYKDTNGNHPVITAVTIVANPDFRRIKESDFQEYYYEPFTETLKKFPGCEQSFEFWRKGMENHIFIPQMHGREHLNVTAWMKALREGDKHTLLAFEEGVTGFVPSMYPKVYYQAAFLPGEPHETDLHKQIIIEGLTLFEQLFGYKAKYFVPPNGPFNNTLNSVLVENGITCRSSAKIQNEPLGNGKYRKVIHWLGQRDKSGLKYITRNCFFEPNTPRKDWVDSCKNDIKISFNWSKPAIISSHRVNYIGSLNPPNRDNGLKQLDNLLKKIIKTWPDVKFITTTELYKLMT